jgi:hypothetical protein
VNFRRVLGNFLFGDTAPSFSSNEALNSIQVPLRSLQTVCHATDELSQVAPRNSQGIGMDSFTIAAVGNLAKDSELAAKEDMTDAHLTVPRGGT